MPRVCNSRCNWQLTIVHLLNLPLIAVVEGGGELTVSEVVEPGTIANHNKVAAAGSGLSVAVAPGDEIVEVNGKGVSSFEECSSLLRQSAGEGRAASITFTRGNGGGEPMKLSSSGSTKRENEASSALE